MELTPHPRAPRRASRAAALAAVAGFLALTGTGCRPPPPPPPQSSHQPWFQDHTGPSGIQFVHRAGTNFFMPDQVGSGVAVLDANGDDLPDLYLVQNLGTQEARNRLFLQESNHRFRDASDGSGLDVAGRGMGAIAGDVNNDGRPDVVLTEYGGTRLFQNVGPGRFTEVTTRAGLDFPRWCAPASFIDYDRDGWLDLVVGAYVDYDPTQICHDVQGRRDFCAPQAFAGVPARLWRNITGSPGAEPRFSDVSETSGILRAGGAALGIVCADFTGDRWPDIFIADDGRPNRLFVNQRDGRFSEEANVRGLALNAMGHTAANMGVAFADVDLDGLGDVFVTHLSEEFHALYRQDQPGLFTDAVARFGIHEQAWRGTGFGTVVADFNGDGLADLAFVNGLVRRATPPHAPVLAGTHPWWAQYAQRAQLFAGTPEGALRDLSPSEPALCGPAAVGRSLALADLDLDGSPDLIVGNTGGPMRLLRNVAPATGRRLSLRLVLPASGGRDAIGAEVIVHTDRHDRWSVLQPATSYLASHAPVVYLSLAADESLRGLSVRWPDGRTERFTPEAVQARGVTLLRQGNGHPEATP